MNPYYINPYGMQIQGQQSQQTKPNVGENVQGFANAFSTIWGAIKGRPDTPDTVIYQQAPEPNNPTITPSWVKWIVIFVVAILLMIAGVLVFRKN